MIDEVAEASSGPDAPPPKNKGGRPKSDTITLTRQARDRCNRKVVQNIDTLFDALFDAATKGGGVNAARLLIDRAIPSRRGPSCSAPSSWWREIEALKAQLVWGLASTQQVVEAIQADISRCLSGSRKRTIYFRSSVVV